MAYDKSTTERRPALNTVLTRLYKFAESENIAADLEDTEDGKTQLAEIGQRVVEEFGIDERSRYSWELTAKKAMEVALQMKQAKNHPFPNASNVKYPLIGVAALQFNARSYPEICGPDGIVKAKVVGRDDGIPEIDPATGEQAVEMENAPVVDPATGQPAVDPMTGQPVMQPQPVVDPETGEPALIWRLEPGAKREKADRISEHMTYQLSEEMEGWEDDMDTLLMQLPIVGDVVKKVYRGEDGNVSEMIPAFDFIVNQNTKSLKKAPRAMHRLKLYPYEVEERIADGRWLDCELGEAQTDANDKEGNQGDKDAPHVFLEQHRRIDLDKDGYPEPYIVTVHKDSGKVVRIVANYEQEDVKANDKRILKITPAEYFVNYVFIPDPEGGFYGIGFGRLLESIGAAIDTTINQMLDAGNLQNSGGGFIGSGVRLKSGVIRRELGVYHTVQSSGDNLRNNIVNFEDPGPSPVLFQLLGLMIEAAKDITAVKDVLTGETGGQTQTATTTLALIEQGMKVFTAIYKRIYRSLKKEFKLLFRLNAQYLDEQAYFNVMDTTKAVAKADYNEDDYDVCPQADPRLVTDMQRLKRAEAVFATLEVNPESRIEILRRYYSAIGVEDIEKLVPDEPQGPSPAEELALADAEAEVKKKVADTGKAVADTELSQAKTAETVAGIEQKNAEIEIDAMRVADEEKRAEDDDEFRAVETVLGEARADKDRDAAEKAAKAKQKQPA